MNRRFFLKLFPAASAAAALPAVVTGATPEPKLPEPAPLSEKWQGDGYYEVLDAGKVQILSVVRFSPYDCKNDGRCFRFDPRIPFSDGEIVYRYEAAIDAVLVRKVGEF
ncbi:hypothetical protein [Brucella pituitosa]|uniref:Twin-arginine translocation signal domain-containing protein n=1 Tax=Brucella pituitosa TaxID=571256 RepID=A0A643F061_9HYPH|nr:hypothetical protein [Brucella pituitosa]KAB0571073.1 hypothetical protein F7Q93_14000 [Brucella pituitosa]